MNSILKTIHLTNELMHGYFTLSLIATSCSHSSEYLLYQPIYLCHDFSGWLDKRYFLDVVGGVVRRRVNCPEQGITGRRVEKGEQVVEPSGIVKEDAYDYRA